LNNIGIICNRNAGRGRAPQLLDAIMRRLKEEGIPFTLLNGDETLSIDTCSRIWIIGGDGTLNRFINAYPNVTIPLAIFKGGTGNDFAWKIHGEKSFDECFETALRGEPRPIDAGICNKKYFINGVGIGFDAEVARAINNGGKRKSDFSYLAAVLQKIFRYAEKQMTLQVGGQVKDAMLFMVTAANGSRYGGGFLVAPQAVIDDGLLDIVLIKKVPPILRFAYLPMVKKGKHLHLPFVETMRCDHICISSDNCLAAHLDGEILEGKIFDIQILPAHFSFLF